MTTSFGFEGLRRKNLDIRGYAGSRLTHDWGEVPSRGWLADRRGIGIIGLGMASLPHAKNLQALTDRVDVRAVSSPSAARLDDILDNPAIDMIVLLTPPNARLGIVFQHRFREASHALRACLAAGEFGDIQTVQLAIPWWPTAELLRRARPAAPVSATAAAC